jgi:hypothetical protein
MVAVVAVRPRPRRAVVEAIIETWRLEVVATAVTWRSSDSGGLVLVFPVHNLAANKN